MFLWYFIYGDIILLFLKCLVNIVCYLILRNKLGTYFILFLFFHWGLLKLKIVVHIMSYWIHICKTKLFKFISYI